MFSGFCQNIFETILGSPTRLCRHFFKQQLTDWLLAKTVPKTANQLFNYSIFELKTLRECKKTIIV